MAHSLVTVALVLACLVSSSLAQICPATGLPPALSKSAFSRCPEAKQSTCCLDCADVGIGLSLVSSNASNLLQNVSPLLLPTLKGEDLTFCTVVYPAATCQDQLEALGCALSCNPDMGNYVTLNETRNINICSNFSDALQESCRYAQVTGSTNGTNQTFLTDVINSQFFLQALTNMVTGGLGVPRFTANVTDDLPCYAGPKTVTEKRVCCDDLSVSPSCPSGAIDFVAHPSWAGFSGKWVDNNTCRVANPFPAAPLPPLSPPPPSPPSLINITNNLVNTTNAATPSVAGVSLTTAMWGALAMAILGALL